MSPDDLTTIRGIGSNMQQRLNEAGIYTYAQLAASTPDEVRQGLGTVGQLAKVEEWIEQARELV
jgi:small subunit ribosomal protein S2